MFVALRPGSRVLTALALRVKKIPRSLERRALFRSEKRRLDLQRETSPHSSDFSFGPDYPLFADRDSEAGDASGHYFHQDLVVAREIFRNNPRRHIDVGSSIYGFVSHVASFRDIEVLDIRPVVSPVAGISFIKQNVMELDDTWNAAADSVSCLHALEHFGLGRYGDPIDYDGWRRGFEGIVRLVEPGGTVYLSVPTGTPQRIEFNAHRVFALPFLREFFSVHLDILSLSFVLDDGSLRHDVDPFSTDAERSFDSKYGCSIWTLRKSSVPRLDVARPSSR